MNIEEITSQLSGVKRSGNGYAAKCPAHDDRHSSLSVTEADGRVLMHCHAGCNYETVVKALGNRHPDLYENGGGVRSPHAEKKVVAVYTYKDEAGNELYENVRYEPKDFRQRCRDENGREKWNLDGVRRVPYQLPELLPCIRAAADVFMCEGEKDVESLRKLGLTATNFKNWDESFNRFIPGANVIILADHDEPGARLALKAAEIVAKSAASVKIIDVFSDREMTQKNGPDISDWIDQLKRDEALGNEEIAERLSTMADNTTNWKPEPAGISNDLFVYKPASGWIEESKLTPVPKMLCGKLWFEGELCILFADTNVGKSILAVQIADAISRGNREICVAGGEPGLLIECESQKVIYYDFELTAKQFESRFAQHSPGEEYYKDHYEFHPNLIRAEINPDADDHGSFRNSEEYLNHALEKGIIDHGAKVLIVDNLTYLRDETENASSALPLMKFLKSLKSKYRLSILALAHTPKRDSTKQLGRNDLQGSKMLINFCDSSFAIGESQKEPSLRYIKQIKARNTEIVYNADNVLMGTIQKQHGQLGFHFSGTGNERDHLRVTSDADRDNQIALAREKSAAGRSSRDIAADLGVSHTSVNRWLKDKN